MPKEAGNAIDEDSLKGLDEAKAKKVRKFVLMVKGGAVSKLVVFKKGSFGSQIQKAKGEGFKGEPLCGAVTGSGSTLSFMFAGNDTVAAALGVPGVYTAEPVAATKVKAFLSANDLSFKAEIKLVTDAAAVADETTAPTGGTPPTTPPTPPPTPPPPTPPEDPLPVAPTGGTVDKSKFEQFKNALMPKIKEALAANTPERKAIADGVMKAGKLEKEAKYTEALDELKKLVDLVKAALAAAALLARQKKEYEDARPGYELKVKMLKVHPQAAAVKAEAAEADKILKAAQALAAKHDYVNALAKLPEIDPVYEAGKFAADKTAEYRMWETRYRITNNNLDKHQGIAGVDKADRKKLADEFIRLDKLIKERKWDDTLQCLVDIDPLRQAIKATANRHGDYVGRLHNLQLRVKALEAHPNAAAIKAEIAAIKKDYITAGEKEYAKGGKFEEAITLLFNGDLQCTTARDKADLSGQADYDKARDELNVRIGKLKVDPYTEIAKEEVKDLEAQVTRANAIAGTKNYPEATKALGAAAKACTAAEAEARRKADSAQAADAAGKAVAGSDTDAKAALAGVAEVQKLHDLLKKHPQAAVIKTELTGIQTNITNAKKSAA